MGKGLAMRHGKRLAHTIIVACALALACAKPVAADESVYRHQARPGDTLIGLGQALLIRPSDWPKLARLNRIGNPRRIQVGTQLLIPVALMKATPAPGLVVATVGEASLVAPQGQTTAAQVGAPLLPGTEIRTGVGGYVTVQLADGSVLRLQSSTTALVERSDHYESAGFFASKLRLIKGRIEALVAHLTGGEPRFQVKTPQALLGVRGTEFRIGVDPDRQATVSEVLDGAVSVGASQAKARRAQWVAAGFGTQVTSDHGAMPPVQLPSPPDLSAVPALHERIVVRIHVPSVAGSTAYRAQIAQDADFRQVQAELIATAPEFRFANLPDGHYHLRLRAADTHGIEGPDATRQIHLKARPEPPIASLPPPGGKVRAIAVALAWAGQTEAARYHLQIAPGTGFDQTVHDQADLIDTNKLVELPVGDYVWRVASIRPDGDHGPFGDPQS
ncbi:MAG: hypothetical protein EOP38_25750, partial [Rubrivivax sp.]